jgi:phospholipid transport system substrate-binding protein
LRWAAVQSALLLVVLAGAAAPGAQDEGPMARTKQVLQRSHDIVVGPGEHKQKVRTLNDLLRDFLDTDAMGRAAMGSHLDGRSPAEVRAFLDTFRELFVRTYVQRLLLFEAPDFAYQGETITGDRAKVETDIVTPKDRFGVDYEMRKSGGTWRATDILVEDASLGDNFRSQFDAALAKESFDSLMERLHKKVSEPEKPAL